MIARITPSTLTIAVVGPAPAPVWWCLVSLTHQQLMDSMDWFDPSTEAALIQVLALHKVLKTGGRVLFRSAALRPWYTTVFEEHGFACTCVGKRSAGKCIDR